MTPDPNVAVKLTYEDYCRIPPDGLQHQILDGEHVVTPSPRLRHQETLLSLANLMVERLHKPGLARVFVAPFDVILGRHDVVQPDLLVVVPAHAERIHDNGVHGSPDLVVEVLSPGTRDVDLGKKKARYAHAGVPELWAVDPDERTLAQFAMFDADYELRGTHTDRVQIAILPEVVLDLREIWSG